MAFYVGQIGNPKTGFDDVREYLVSEEERRNFLIKHNKGRDKVYNLRKAKNLAELLYEASNGYASDEVLKHITVKNYKDLVNRFGQGLLRKEFPNDSVNEKLFDEIEKLNVGQYDTSDDKPNHDRDKRGQDINQDFPEDGDDGFWRIARDNG